MSHLLEFGCVYVFNNYTFQDPTGLGNVLADYIDDGGTVVLNTPHPGRHQGRVLANRNGKRIGEPKRVPLFLCAVFTRGAQLLYLPKLLHPFHTLMDEPKNRPEDPTRLLERAAELEGVNPLSAATSYLH
ncbi:hypothetical protein KAU45_09830, partial [bacterium]|nr:hypothetical protein [bacterium]